MSLFNRIKLVDRFQAVTSNQVAIINSLNSSAPKILPGILITLLFIYSEISGNPQLRGLKKILEAGSDEQMVQFNKLIITFLLYMIDKATDSDILSDTMLLNYLVSVWSLNNEEVQAFVLESDRQGGAMASVSIFIERARKVFPTADDILFLMPLLNEATKRLLSAALSDSYLESRKRSGVI